MANQTCTQMLKLCALRVLRLAPDGSIEDGASSRYVTGSALVFGYTPVAPDRERFEQVNGCGDTCGLFVGSSKAIESVTLRLDLCNLDAELEELLTGGSVIQDESYNTIGYSSSTDATVNADGVAIETWSYQWDGKQRALVDGNPGWYRHLFPKTYWTAGERVEQNGFSTIPLTGEAIVNSGFGTGLAGDDAFPVTSGESAYHWVVTDELPAAECGYLAVPVP